MRAQVFDFEDYKKYLLKVLNQNETRGQRTRLAAVMNCHTAYVSQVLNGKAQISLEQAVRVNEFLGHSREEGHFFLLLVQLARAGSAELKEYFRGQIRQILAQRLQVKNRIPAKRLVSAAHQSMYYSSWHYPAVHMALTIPSLRSPENLARAFALSLGKVGEILQFLVEAGLARENGKEFVAGESALHLNNDSPLIARHHANWRLRAMAAMDDERASDLHYSSVVSAAHADLPQIKAILIRTIEEIRSVVKTSSEEAVVCYAMDLFSLTN
ncbi:MAG: TIGR02147 family protein [Bdellovibrionales bacterium]|nr:TIGR02147 family protein [Bdellovibrionales bacterium]